METRLCYNVSIENDVVYEGPEDFLVGLSTTVARIDLDPDSARIRIIDDDGNNLLLVTIFIVLVGCTYLFICKQFLIFLFLLAYKLSIYDIVVIFILVSDCDWLGGHCIFCD